MYNKNSKCELPDKTNNLIDRADPKEILELYDFHKIQIKNNGLVNYLTTVLIFIYSNIIFSKSVKYYQMKLNGIMKI